MAGILSQDEIDALLSAVKKTEDDDQDQITDALKEIRSVVPYDFKKPNRLSKEQVRSFHTIHDNFARQLGSSLSTQLRTMIKINLVSLEQIPYSDYIASLPNPDCIYICSIEGVTGNFILELNPQIIFSLLERTLGGEGVPLLETRVMTDIESSVMKRIINLSLDTLSDAWKHIGNLNFILSYEESTPQFVWIVSPMESVLLVTMEIKTDTSSGVMTICYPYIVIKPVVPDFDIRFHRPTQSTGLFKELINDVSVPLIGILGNAKLTIKELLEARVGDTIRLDTNINSEISTLIGGGEIFKGKMGLMGRKKALMIIKKAKMINGEDVDVKEIIKNAILGGKNGTGK